MRTLFISTLGMVVGLTFSFCATDTRTLGVVLLILAGFVVAILGEGSERRFK